MKSSGSRGKRLAKWRDQQRAIVRLREDCENCGGPGEDWAHVFSRSGAIIGEPLVSFAPMTLLLCHRCHSYMDTASTPDALAMRLRLRWMVVERAYEALGATLTNTDVVGAARELEKMNLIDKAVIGA